MKKRYIKKLDMELSPLGFGVMRLPMKGDAFPESVYELLNQAINAGINYFDTAYPYQGGHSEELVRKALVEKYPRNRFYIADKLPVWECRNKPDMERIFEMQLERLGVDYIDFYLLHGLHKSRWYDIYNKGVLDFLELKRKEGKIHKVGFSLHDTHETLAEIEQTYDWDFIQLQINYYDWIVQNANKSYDYLESRGIPCFVMEPVGGGRLSKLPGEAESLLRLLHPDQSLSSWAIKFVASLPNAAVILSGMNSQEQLEDNILSVSQVRPLENIEKATLDRVVKIICSFNQIPCTGCRYCVEGCPKSIDIPQIFQRYNDYKTFENMARFDIDYFAFIPEGKRGNACIGCNKCSMACPQNIKIPENLRDIDDFAVSLLTGLNFKELKILLKKSEGTQLVCFGAGQIGKRVQKELLDNGFDVHYFCDNSPQLWGTQMGGASVISPGQLQDLNQNDHLIVIITSIHFDEISDQLKKLNVAAYSEIKYR